MSVVRALNNIKCKEYCQLHNLKYTVIQAEGPQKVYKPNHSGNPKSVEYIEVAFPEIYVAELKDISVVGNNYIAFDDNNYCIYDLPFMDYENKFDLKCNDVFKIDRNNTFINFDESLEELEEGVTLLSCCAYNYSHFLLEVVAKVCLINKMEEYAHIPLLVDEVCSSIPQYKEALDMLNKQGRKIIPLKRGHRYKVKNLLYISDLGVYPFDIKPGFEIKFRDVVLSDLNIKVVRDSLAIKSNIYRKVYISRRYLSTTRLQNLEAVENIFKDYGYEIVYPEHMSFHDQLKVFSEAEFIAGASGAGLTNIIFGNENTKVILFQSKTINSPWYSNIAGILGLETYFLDVELYINSNLHYYQSVFTLNENYLRNFLDGV